MTICYCCRYCGCSLGSLNHHHMHAISLGLEQLSEVERQAIVSYLKDGTVKIKTVCENCEEILEKNPTYYEYDTFLQ